MIYRLFFKLVLERIDPECAHALASGALRRATRMPPARSVLRRALGARDPRLEVRALGRTFPSPLGVAAGVDKDASWFDGLGAIGFGFVEVGTVTALPQDGNPGKRVFRLTRDRALLNRMGFPNPGARALVDRLRRRSGETIVGINVGKSRLVVMEDAGDDYRASLRLLARLSDYVVLNVSSPNTPGLREMQASERLRSLVAAVRDELADSGGDVPVLVKIAPDLGDQEIDSLADLCVELRLDGIVAINTTVDLGVLAASADEAAAMGFGGVSGAPLKARALEVLRRLHARVGDDLVLISVGGIETADDVWQRVLAGATLVQAYTGFVYGGPLWPRRINRELAERTRAAGSSSIQELIGLQGRAHTGRSGRSG